MTPDIPNSKPAQLAGVQPRHVLITGLPRAGTTLLTALVDGLDNSVALSEPREVVELARATHDANRLSREILDFHRAVASALLVGRAVHDIRGADGVLITDYVRREGPNARIDKPLHAIEPRPLSADFLLASKHNSLYTALLEPLLQQDAFQVLAIVREPLDVMTSWADVPLPIARGRLPGAERFWPAVAEIARLEAPVRVRQAMIMELIVARYVTLGDQISLLRYEDLVADPGRVSRLFARRARLDVRIRQRKKEDLPTRARFELRALLKDLAPTAWDLYH